MNAPYAVNMLLDSIIYGLPLLLVLWAQLAMFVGRE